MMIVIKIIIWLLVFQLVEIFGAREPPMVTIPNQGMLLGTYLKMYRTQRIIGYLGIPYAAPPIGPLRFNPPIVDGLPSWDGVRNATQQPPDCFQLPKKELKKHEELFESLLTSQRDSDDSPRPMDEDCLLLSIYIPEGPPPSEGWSIIAWLHSGDYQNGSPSDIDPFQLVLKQKVIVVTIAYRLNIFGFFTSIDGESPGNYGLMDQSAALLWIQKNIKLFGGNEKSVTLMGHGSGALSVGFHLTSGIWTEGVFHKAIIMSGSPLWDYSVREAKSYSASVDQLSNAYGCFRKPTSKLLDCLRHVPAHLLADNGPVFDWGPVIDLGLSNITTPFIPDYPKTLVERGMLRNVSLLIGFTDMEEALDISMGFIMDDGITEEMYQTLIEDVILNDISQLEMNDTCGGNNKIILDTVNFVYKPYPPVTDTSKLRRKYIDFNTERKFIAPIFYLSAQMSKTSEVYAYRFDIKPKTPAAIDGLPEWVSVPHRFDLIFVWGFPYWSKLPDVPSWDNTDKRVSDIIMTLWANFAKFTNPSQLGVYIKWDPFTVQNQAVLIIDRSFNMSDASTIHYPGIQFWNSYYQEVIDFASQCCNATNSGETILNFFNFNYHKNINFLCYIHVKRNSLTFIILLILSHLIYYLITTAT